MALAGTESLSNCENRKLLPAMRCPPGSKTGRIESSAPHSGRYQTGQACVGEWNGAWRGLATVDTLNTLEAARSHLVHRLRSCQKGGRLTAMAGGRSFRAAPLMPP
jgi:hypothetical protein